MINYQAGRIKFNNINRGRCLCRAGFDLLSCLMFCCLIVTAGCGSSSRSALKPKVTKSNYIDVEKFCSEYGFRYSYDTIDDIIYLNSNNKEVELLIDSPIGLYNGSSFNLDLKTVRFGGKIIIPRKLLNIISSKKYTSFKPVFSIERIVIDPGHGGKDPGAISRRGLKEKRLNLIIARILKRKLESKGYSVFLTRNNDTFVSLKNRTKFAKDQKADLFISIHANANRSRSIKGVEIYYLNSSRLNSFKRSVKLAKTSNYFSNSISTDAETMLWDMLLTKNYSYSVEVSNLLFFNFKRLGFNVKTPRRAAFYVLRNAYVPSVLVETGYLTNTNEEKTLRKKYYQNQIVEAIVLSINSLQNRYTPLASSE